MLSCYTEPSAALSTEKTQSNCLISNGGFMHLIVREKPEQPNILSEFHKSSLKCWSTRKREIINCVLLPSSNLLIQEYHHSLWILWNKAVMNPVFSGMSQNKWMHMDLSAWSSLSEECNNWPALVCGIQAALTHTSSSLAARETCMGKLLSSTAIFF